MNKSSAPLIVLLLILAGVMGFLLFHANGTPTARASATPAPAVTTSSRRGCVNGGGIASRHRSCYACPARTREGSHARPAA